MNKFIVILSVIVAAFCAGYISGCNGRNAALPNTIVTIDSSYAKSVQTKYDSAIKAHATYTPKPITIIKPNNIDSAKIYNMAYATLQKCFTKVVYADTIRDNNIAAYITDTLQNNFIASRQFSYRILKPDSIITVINTIKETHKVVWSSAWHLGATVAAPANAGYLLPMAALQYQTHNYAIQLAANNSAASVGILFNIKKKHKTPQ